MKELPDYLKPLERWTPEFPAAAVREAIARKNESIPHLLCAIEWVMENPEEVLSADPEYLLHLYALFLLAQFREGSGYLPAVNFARHPLVDPMLGDLVADGLHSVLASVSGGDPDPVKSLIEDREADEWARGSGIRTLGAMYRAEMISRETLSSYLGELFEGKLERSHSNVWDSLTSMCADFRLGEHLDAMGAAFEEGIADPGFEPLESIEERIFTAGLDERDLEDYTLIDDSMALFATWYRRETDFGLVRRTPADSDDDVKDERNEQFPEQGELNLDLPYRRETPKVGRNDLCLCGSGKKYKKCCGK